MRRISFPSSRPTAKSISGFEAERMNSVGIGYDVHRLVEGRKLILGGVEIPHSLGLDGHSDADVLSHAIADALLGAAGERDIGHFFPNTDESIRGMSSLGNLSKA